MGRRTETPYQVDGTDKLAQHRKVRCLVPEINGALAQGKFTFLLREICASSTAATPGTTIRESRRRSTEVSRGHRTGSHEPGHTPEELTTREGLNLADSTTRCWTETTDEAGWWSRVPRQQGRGESADSSFGTIRNRRTRTRMSGGVGGGRQILPPTRFLPCHLPTFCASLNSLRLAIVPARSTTSPLASASRLSPPTQFFAAPTMNQERIPRIPPIPKSRTMSCLFEFMMLLLVCVGFGRTKCVSHGRQPPLTHECGLSRTAASRWLNALVGRSRYAEWEEDRAVGVHVGHTARPMTPLREEYQRDMTVRGLFVRTQQSYASSVADLARYHHRSPDQISYDEVVDWVHHLIRERHSAASSVLRAYWPEAGPTRNQRSAELPRASLSNGPTDHQPHGCCSHRCPQAPLWAPSVSGGGASRAAS